jgi:hypothetical protein
MRYSKGISWIDDVRIPFVDEKILIKGYETNAMDIWYEKDKGKLLEPTINTQGRFPANILVCDDMLNDGVISKSSGHKRNNKKKQTIYGGGKGFPPIVVENVPDDKGTNSRYYDIDKWFNNLIDG